MWKDFYQAFEPCFGGQRAVYEACEQNRIERFFTFPNLERSAERCGDVLRAAGLSDVAVEEFPADGKTLWSGWGRIHGWDVERAQLHLVAPHEELLADWDIKPQHLIMYSGPAEGEFEVVEWDGQPDADLNGKLPLTGLRVNDVFAQMRALDSRGVLSDFIGTLPGVRDRFDLPDDVRWENSALRPGQGAFWGFQLTPRKGQMLRDLMRKGPVRVRVEIKSRNYNTIFKSATGRIRGAETPEEEILFVTHLYEPGGNDNASGVGVGLEMARALNAAIEAGTIARPKRSIRFLFNWEGYGLYAWMHKHAERLPKILGGLNIDEIGVDQAKGHSVLHLFMPPAANPSCIGPLVRHLCEEILTPSIRWKAVADRAEIINDTIPSDPHMDVVLPCMIQYPSSCYHSSADTPDMLSPEVMKAVGMVSATHLYFLANCGEEETQYLARLAAADVRRTLSTIELRLLERAWPFNGQRTVQWLTEQANLTADSLQRFSTHGGEADALRYELAEAIRDWGEKHADRFVPPQPRTAPEDVMARARTVVLERTTLGTPKAWGSINFTPEEETRYRDVLYANNLDLLFHRICYWADGTRSVLDIVERLEFELDELQRDTSISRTSSGLAIDSPVSPELDLEAVLYVVDQIIRGGYLRSMQKG